MKCERIQEVLLTDYIDGYLDEKSTQVVNDHLSGCPRCREFLAVVKIAAVKPFSDAKKVNPPAGLWLKIKERVETDQQNVRENLFDQFVGNLRKTFFEPKPVFAFALVLMLLFLGGITTKIISSQISKSEQMEYLAFLTQPSDDTAISEEKGLGTFIEQYFL